MFKLILKLGHSTSIVSLSGSKDHNFIRLEGPLFYPARRTIIVGLGLKLKLIFVGLDLNILPYQQLDHDGGVAALRAGGAGGGDPHGLHDPAAATRLVRAVTLRAHTAARQVPAGQTALLLRLCECLSISSTGDVIRRQKIVLLTTFFE